MAAGRARALRELAVLDGGDDRDALEPRRRSSRSCRARGAPPAFGSYDAWEAWVERLVALGVMEDYTRIWWDVRPHPRFGTLEIRIADQPTSLERHARCSSALVRDARRGRAARRTADRGDYVQNRWAAARSGLDAELIHPDGDRRRLGARARARAARRASRPSPEALAQLAAARAVAADLVARTVA